MASDPSPYHSQLFDSLQVQRSDFQERLYRAAQAATPSDTQVDELLAEHRRMFGEPEQVAYAQHGDPCDERLHLPALPLKFEDLAVKFGRPGSEQLRDYLQEHRQWKAKRDHGMSL